VGHHWPTFLILSFIIGVLMVLLRKAWENVLISGHVVLWANQILPYVVIFAVSMFGIRRILAKKFRSFYIALLPRDASGVEPLARSFQRTVRVWWAFIWRAVVYSVIFRIAGSIAVGLTIGIPQLPERSHSVRCVPCLNDLHCHLHHQQILPRPKRLLPIYALLTFKNRGNAMGDRKLHCLFATELNGRGACAIMGVGLVLLGSSTDRVADFRIS